VRFGVQEVGGSPALDGAEGDARYGHRLPGPRTM